MMPIFRYTLNPHNGHVIESFVEAENKTAARKLIAEAYREDTPRGASRSGFVPFNKCTLSWIEDEEAPVQESSWRAKEDRMEQPQDPLVISDPRIGVLMREGSPVYYAYVGGDYKNGYVEGSLQEVEQQLAKGDSNGFSDN